MFCAELRTNNPLFGTVSDDNEADVVVDMNNAYKCLASCKCDKTLEYIRPMQQEAAQYLKNDTCRAKTRTTRNEAKTVSTQCKEALSPVCEPKPDSPAPTPEEVLGIPENTEAEVNYDLLSLDGNDSFQEGEEYDFLPNYKTDEKVKENIASLVSSEIPPPPPPTTGEIPATTQPHLKHLPIFNHRLHKIGHLPPGTFKPLDILKG